MTAHSPDPAPAVSPTLHVDLTESLLEPDHAHIHTPEIPEAHDVIHTFPTLVLHTEKLPIHPIVKILTLHTVRSHLQDSVQLAQAAAHHRIKIIPANVSPAETLHIWLPIAPKRSPIHLRNSIQWKDPKVRLPIPRTKTMAKKANPNRIFPDGGEWTVDLPPTYT